MMGEFLMAITVGITYMLQDKPISPHLKRKHFLMGK